MINQLFLSPFVRRRMAASHLGIILERFAIDLHARGYSTNTLQSYVQICEHFSRWLGACRHRLSVQHIDEQSIEGFVSGHLPRCRCQIPAATHQLSCRSALRCLLRFLYEQKLTYRPSPLPCWRESLIEGYDRHLSEVAGLSTNTRYYRRRYAREFLGAILSKRCKRNLAALRAADISRYVEKCARRLKPASLSVLSVSLRSFLRYLSSKGRLDKRLADSVPHPAPWPIATLPKVLSRTAVRALLTCFDRNTAVGRRDFAIAMLMADLGLRCQEVASLTLEDLEPGQSALRLRETKQRRERLVPWTPNVAQALSAYLHSRLPSSSNSLFLRHRALRGSPMRVHHVRSAMRRAFARADISSGKIHLLRHTLATRLHSTGVDLKQIADLLGHQSLDTTARYARVDVQQLRQASLPWPGGSR